MDNDFEIGRVIGVDTAQVTIELNKDIRALTRSTYEGVQEVGRINSYVIMPVGFHRLVAMVTRVVISEEAEVRADRTMVTLPSSRRIMKATLIGTIDGQIFTQGVSVFPALDNPVLLPAKQDLDVIFDRPKVEDLDPEKPGYCIAIGESTLFKGRKIHINPDTFFGKHAAVLGSTGSGKSCTIAALIQSILEMDEVQRTNFIVLDTNGEYRSAFFRQTHNGSWAQIGKARCLYIPSDPMSPKDRLVIPYWFLNSDDFVRLFRAGPGVQRPVLLEALRLARSPSMSHGGTIELRQVLLRELQRLIAQAEDSGKTSREVEDLAKGCQRFIQDRTGDLEELLGEEADRLANELEAIAANARPYVGEPDGRRFSNPLPVNVQQDIRTRLNPIVDKMVGLTGSGCLSTMSADNPLYFRKLAFKRDYIEKAMRHEETGGTRARDYCGTMLMRMYRLLEDTRFEFLFGPIDSEWPEPLHSLATFIRDILGLPSGSAQLSSMEDIKEAIFPFYDRQRSGSDKCNLVIVDLSLLASEVLENVTALIGRLVLEFLQRLGEYDGESARCSLPVVLILEEAQNYIRERFFGEEESISREVFERIAREGRKYGLGLLVSSQRPSELSKTVLSQCSSFIVHRLQNPEDLRYFKEIVPTIYGGLLDQLPALAPQTALVLGECSRAPALVRIQDARALPRSRDPKFFKYWVSKQAPDIEVEKICARWEGREQSPSPATTEDTVSPVSIVSKDKKEK